MKTKRVYGMMALFTAVMLVFSFAGCGGDGGGGNGIKTGSGWPSDSILSKYGVGGMTQPDGTSNIIYGYGIDKDSGDDVLSTEFDYGGATASFFFTWFANDGGWKDSAYGGAYFWEKGKFEAVYQTYGSKAYFSVINNETSSGSGGNGGGPGGNPGGSYGSGWPPANILTEYGIPGMPVPAGGTAVEWNVYSNNLYIFYKGDASAQNAVGTWLTDNGWTGLGSGIYMKSGKMASLYTEEGDRVIMVGNY